MAAQNWFERRDVVAGSVEFDELREEFAKAREQHERKLWAEPIQVKQAVRVETYSTSPFDRSGSGSGSDSGSGSGSRNSLIACADDVSPQLPSFPPPIAIATVRLFSPPLESSSRRHSSANHTAQRSAGSFPTPISLARNDLAPVPNTKVRSKAPPTTGTTLPTTAVKAPRFWTSK